MNFHGPVHPAAYALVTAAPVTLPIARTARSRVQARPRQRCLIRLRSNESAMPAIFGQAAVQPGRDADPPSPGRRAPAAGKDPEDVLWLGYGASTVSRPGWDKRSRRHG